MEILVYHPLWEAGLRTLKPEVFHSYAVDAAGRVVFLVAVSDRLRTLQNHNSNRIEK